jgi:hypothetical protein
LEGEAGELQVQASLSYIARPCLRKRKLETERKTERERDRERERGGREGGRKGRKEEGRKRK